MKRETTDDDNGHDDKDDDGKDDDDDDTSSGGPRPYRKPDTVLTRHASSGLQILLTVCFIEIWLSFSVCHVFLW